MISLRAGGHVVPIQYPVTDNNTTRIYAGKEGSEPVQREGRGMVDITSSKTLFLVHTGVSLRIARVICRDHPYFSLGPEFLVFVAMVVQVSCPPSHNLHLQLSKSIF